MLHARFSLGTLTVLLLHGCLLHSCQQRKLGVVGGQESAASTSQALRPYAKQRAEKTTVQPSSAAGLTMTSSASLLTDAKQRGTANSNSGNTNKAVANKPERSARTLPKAIIATTEIGGEVARKRPALTQESGQESQAADSKQAKKEKLFSQHKAWFTSFTEAVAKIEQDTKDEKAWSIMDDVLDEGRKHNFLTASIMCPNDSNPATDYEYTPLHYVAARGIRILVRDLAENENIPVDIQTQGNKNTPLHLASSRGHLDVVEFLIEQGADPNLVDNEGGSAIHYAAAGTSEEMNRDVVECLIKKGADFKKAIKSGSTMLGIAAITGNIPVVEYWEDNYVNSPDPDIDTLTKKALLLAKCGSKRGPQEWEVRADIIRILEDFLKARQNKSS